jgi:hypothetical protein
VSEDAKGREDGPLSRSTTWRAKMLYYLVREPGLHVIRVGNFDSLEGALGLRENDENDDCYILTHEQYLRELRIILLWDKHFIETAVMSEQFDAAQRNAAVEYYHGNEDSEDEELETTRSGAIFRVLIDDHYNAVKDNTRHVADELIE